MPITVILTKQGMEEISKTGVRHPVLLKSVSLYLLNDTRVDPSRIWILTCSASSLS